MKSKLNPKRAFAKKWTINTLLGVFLFGMIGIIVSWNHLVTSYYLHISSRWVEGKVIHSSYQPHAPVANLGIYPGGIGGRYSIDYSYIVDGHKYYGNDLVFARKFNPDGPAMINYSTSRPEYSQLTMSLYGSYPSALAVGNIFFPTVGLIFWLLYIKKNGSKARQYIKYLALGFTLASALSIIFGIFFLW